MQRGAKLVNMSTLRWLNKDLAINLAQAKVSSTLAGSVLGLSVSGVKSFSIEGGGGGKLFHSCYYLARQQYGRTLDISSH